MNATSSASVSRCAARPETTWAMRPAQRPRPTSASPRSCTTKARVAGSGRSSVPTPWTKGRAGAEVLTVTLQVFYKWSGEGGYHPGREPMGTQCRFGPFLLDLPNERLWRGPDEARAPAEDLRGPVPSRPARRRARLAGGVVAGRVAGHRRHRGRADRVHRRDPPGPRRRPASGAVRRDRAPPGLSLHRERGLDTSAGLRPRPGVESRAAVPRGTRGRAARARPVPGAGAAGGVLGRVRERGSGHRQDDAGGCVSRERAGRSGGLVCARTVHRSLRVGRSLPAGLRLR